MNYSFINSPHFNAIDHFKLQCSNETKEPCGICMDLLDQHEPKKTTKKCNHAFHPSCLRTWNRINPNCPLCRMPTSSRVPDSDLEKIREQVQADQQLTIQLENKQNECWYAIEFDDGSVCYVSHVIKKRKEPETNDYERRLMHKLDRHLSVNARLKNFSRKRRQLQNALLQAAQKPHQESMPREVLKVRRSNVRQ